MRRDSLVRSVLVLVLDGLVVTGCPGLSVTAQEATPAAGSPRSASSALPRAWCFS
jgi:hypothetical protein